MGAFSVVVVVYILVGGIRFYSSRNSRFRGSPFKSCASSLVIAFSVEVLAVLLVPSYEQVKKRKYAGADILSNTGMSVKVATRARPDARVEGNHGTSALLKMKAGISRGRVGTPAVHGAYATCGLGE
ncbi:hypothetical protein C8R46DRAFT_1062054 [Mycena filopes]|nr:hypothetical protein C8R46DRAFT_1062054 [Mycena filopes]